MSDFQTKIQAGIKSRVDPSWHSTIELGLRQMATQHPDYWGQLAGSEFFPDCSNIFAAFSLPKIKVRYLLLGEGPYPRAASATGYSFMDGAVHTLWRMGGDGTDGSNARIGLSKMVNRATSLRNFIKMLLVAEGLLNLDNTNDLSQVPISRLIQTGQELQKNLLSTGFLLLNSALVFRPQVAPKRETECWQPMLRTVFQSLAQQDCPPTVLLWGKLAQQAWAREMMPVLPTIATEHPYNLSFIQNHQMHDFFRPLHLLAEP